MPRTKLAQLGRTPEHNVYDLRSLAPTTGNIFFVDSGANSGGNGLSPESAYNTLTAASAACTANNGDVIVVMEGHAETLDSAADVDLTVAGVKIVGLGHGASRPTFTFSTAADGTFAVGANSQWIENLLFVANFTGGVTAGVDIDGAHTDIVFKNCEFRATSATKEFLKAVTIAEGAARVTFEDCRWLEFAGDATAAVFTESTMAGDLRFIRCRIFGTYSVANLDLDDDVITGRLEITNCILQNTDTGAGLGVTNNAGTIAVVTESHIGTNKANTVPFTNGDLSYFLDSQATDQDNTSSIPYPATATAWT